MIARMNLIQRIVAFLGFGLVAFNALFPPRIAPNAELSPVPRAFVFSPEFRKAETNEKHLIMLPGGAKVTLDYIYVTLDMEKFWLTTVAITAATLSAVALCGVGWRRAKPPADSR